MASESRRTKAEKWRELLQRHQTSGLTAVDFCRREGLAESSFYYWRKRLRAGMSPQGEAASGVTDPATTASTPQIGQPGVTIELPGGAIVRLPGDADANLLKFAIHAASKTVRSDCHSRSGSARGGSDQEKDTRKIDAPADE